MIYAVQLASVGVVIAAAMLDVAPWLGAVAIAGVGLVAVVSLNRPPIEARVIGWTQIGVGIGVVLITAAGVHLGI